MGIENRDLDPYFGKLDQAQYGLDVATGSDPKHVLKFDTHPVTGGNPVGKDKPKYADAKDDNITRKNGDGEEVLKTVKDKFVPNADLPTTASAEPGLDLAQIISQVDPMGKAQVFPSMIKQFAQIKSIMNIAAGGGGKTSSPSSSQQNTLVDAFSEALNILCKTTSFIQVMTALDLMLFNNGITRIDSGYQEIVKNGIFTLIQNAIIFGENNIPVKPVPPVVYKTTKPPDNLILSDIFYIADLAIKQYYTEETDPYPGYIQYKNNNGSYSYVKRREIDYPYSTVDKECLALAEKGIADDMYPYIINSYFPMTNIPMFLTTDALSQILITHKVNHENHAMERAIGKGSSTNMMSNLSAILGATGAIVDMAKGSFLSKTTLDSGVVGEALGSFSKGLSMAKQMSGLAQSALKPASSLSNISSVTSVISGLSSAGISMPQIAQAVGGTEALNAIISARGTVAGITQAIASSSSLMKQLNGSGTSVSQIHANSLGQTGPSLISIIASMRASKMSEASIAAATEALRDIGIT
jgi:hypothetical protein